MEILLYFITSEKANIKPESLLKWLEYMTCMHETTSSASAYHNLKEQHQVCLWPQKRKLQTKSH